MIMGLFNKKKTVQPKIKIQWSNGNETIVDHYEPIKEKPLNKLIDGELPWGWITKHEAFTKPIMDKQKEYIAAWVNAPLGSFEKKEALSKYLDFLRSTKAVCEAKGECFSKWFTDIVADEKYFNRLEQELFTL